MSQPLAREVARRKARVLPRMKPQEITVDLWLSAYRELFPDTRTDRTRAHQEGMLGGFRAAYGKRKMHDVTVLEAQAWAMRNPTHVRYLRHAWAKAAAMGVAPLNIWRFVEMPLREKERVRPPTDTELLEIEGRIVELCAPRYGRELVLDPWWPTFLAMVRVAAFSGAREGGLVTLERRDVDLARARMVVTEKGDKTREIALPGPALAALSEHMGRPPAVLAEQRRDTPSARHPHGRMRAVTRITERKLVFTWRDGTPVTEERVQRTWRMVRGGFPHGFHSLKHHAATWLAAQGVEELAIAVQLGHVDAEGRPYADVVRRTYDHPDHEPMLAKVSAL